MTARQLTAKDAASALYIDFEGNENRPPSFIGIRTRQDSMDVFEQVVLEKALSRALALPNPQDHGWPDGYAPVDANSANRVTPLRKADTPLRMVASLVAHAELEDRLIVSWSSHERDLIVEFPDVPSDLKERFVKRWRDAKVTAKAWKKSGDLSPPCEALPGRGRHRLDCYMREIKYCLPSYFGDRKASKRINNVREQLRDGRSADDLTAVAKAKWTKVLNYNWHDCNGMREVTIHAARELESRVSDNPSVNALTTGW